MAISYTPYAIRYMLPKAMTISIITLFPDVFKPLLESSIIAKAQKEKKLRIKLINLRDFGIGPHKQVDDRPYGGGVGMVLRADVIAEAIKKANETSAKRTLTAADRSKRQPRPPSLREGVAGGKARTILLTPQGKTLNQRTARRLSKKKHLILICGHYEGVDERVRRLVDEEISIGDYILSGGEVATMVVLDAITRLLPGVLDKEAIQKESFSKWKMEDGRWKILLEPPQYTRPEEFKGMKVPKVLLSGNHQKIEEWRLREAFKKTQSRRPDLLIVDR